MNRSINEMPFFKIKVVGCGEFGERLISNLLMKDFTKYPIDFIKVDGSENSLLHSFEEDLDFLIVLHDLLDEKCGKYLSKLMLMINEKTTKIMLIKTPKNIESGKQKFNFKRLKDSVNLLISFTINLDSITLSDYFFR